MLNDNWPLNDIKLTQTKTHIDIWIAISISVVRCSLMSGSKKYCLFHTCSVRSRGQRCVDNSYNLDFCLVITYVKYCRCGKNEASRCNGANEAAAAVTTAAAIAQLEWQQNGGEKEENKVCAVVYCVRQ